MELRERMEHSLRIANHAVGQQHAGPALAHIENAIADADQCLPSPVHTFLRAAKDAVHSKYWPGAKHNIDSAMDLLK